MCLDRLRRLPFAATLAALLPVAAPLCARGTPPPSAPQLIPMPQQVSSRPDVVLRDGVAIRCSACDADDTFAADDLRQALAARGIPEGQPGAFTLVLERGAPEAAAPAAMRAESYRITPGEGRLTLAASTAAGLFYAAQTAKQMFTVDPRGGVTLHPAEVHDWPVLRYRGLSDDLSRGPVDTLEYQKHLIRMLAAYKGNVYSPYFEHTQQYAGNPLPAPPAGALSADDARALVAYARPFHVTIIPDQEAFGHLHHNLNNEVYAPLAETPHGTVLAPAQPGSLQLIESMFAELAALYPGPFLHIGADETVDLGQGQTHAAVAAQGLGAVYLDYLQKIDTALRPLDRRLLFWGDIAQDSPDLLKTLPAAFKANTVAVAWWYNPRPQGYVRYIKPFTDAGIETWVAPGINNWSRVYPNWNYAIANIQQFTREGQQMGATGQLNTLWNDDGETLASNDAFGILFGAAQAWQGGTGSASQFEDAYGTVFHGDSTGKLNQAQKELMAAHELLKTEAKVGDASDGLFWLDPWSHDGQSYAAKIRPYTHELRLHAERALTLIAEARAAYPAAAHSAATSGRAEDAPGGSTESFFPKTSLREADSIDALELGARRMDFIGLKFQLADEIPQIYAKAQNEAGSTDKRTRTQVVYDLSSIRGVNGRLEDIVAGYSLLRDMYAELWHRTNRPYALRPVLEHYDYTVGLWYARIDRFRSVERQWDDSKVLPSAAELGLPAVH